MRILEVRREQQADVARVAATIRWEDSPREDKDIFFETSAEYGSGLQPWPDAFLLGAFAPAQRAGERRIAVEGAVCPRLIEGILTAMHVLKSWTGDAHPVPALEFSRPDTVRRPVLEPRSALFFSGGVDSLFSLRRNRRLFPRDHPASFRDAIYLSGADTGPLDRSPWTRGLASVEPLAVAAEIELIPLHTNLRRLDMDPDAYIFRYMGAVLAASAQALAGRIHQATLASTHALADLRPHGSHPHLVHSYSSSAVELLHDGQRYRRLEKVQELASWEPALRHLRVCFEYSKQKEDGGVNCGRCHKCVRTMLELVAAGADPARVKTLPIHDLDATLVRRIRPGGWNRNVYLFDLDAPLRAAGRADLADALAEVLRRKQRRERWRRLLRRPPPPLG